MSFILFSENNLNDSNDINYNIMSINNNLFKRLLCNELHRKFKYEIDKKKMQEKFNLVIDTENEKVEFIAMPELNKNQLELYLSTFEDEIDNIAKYSEYLAIITYNQVPTKYFKVTQKLNELLENQNTYWEDKFNCNLTLNDKFINRKFNFNVIQKKIEMIDTAIGNTAIGNNEIINKLKNIHNEDLDYIKELYFDKSNYVEISKAINHNYYSSTISKHTNAEIVEIYKKIPTTYLKYSFICNMICSRAHCHLILNNNELLSLTEDIFNSYSGIFKYIIGYAWITFRLEEGIKKTNIKDDDSFVFDIDTANKLPVFPFSFDDLNQNPYSCLLLDNQYANIEKNCLSIPMIKTNYKKYYGVCDSKTFKKRLNIFVNGTDHGKILDKIDWNHYVISGSALTACGMKYNPLMDLFKNKNSELTDIDIANYFYHYYNNSDIDLISNEKSIYTFLDSVINLIDDMTIEYNSPVKCDNVHTASIIISDDFLVYEFENIQKILKSTDLTIKDIKNSFDNELIKEYFYNKYYVPWKNQQNIDVANKKGNIIYDSYLDKVPCNEFRLYTLDYEIIDTDYEKQDYEKYYFGKDIGLDNNMLVCKLAESIRFKLKSPNMNRQFEVFKIKNKNFFSTVSKFHMGFVRAFWNGTTVKCLPSYISSMMLQLSSDYNYFASIRDPIEIINKYRSRGFGIILNDTEKVHMAYYNSLKPSNEENKWNNMYKVNIKNKQSVLNIFGCKNINDDIFKPSKFFNGADNDCFHIVNHEYINNFDQAFGNFFSKSNEFMSRLKCINNKGYIAPLQKEYIKLFWETINFPQQQVNKLENINDVLPELIKLKHMPINKHIPMEVD
jgi:hypothetical protein